MRVGPKVKIGEVYWYAVRTKDVSPALSSDISVDVVIVGGGVAGLSAAERLLTAGLRVALLEKEFCGAGASGKTSGFVTPDSEIELSSLVRTYGAEEAGRIWGFVVGGVERIRSLIETNNISCDFLPQDSLFIATRKNGVAHVEEEYESRKRLGYQSMLYSKEELHTIIGSDRYFGGVRYPDTFGLNSYEFCQGLRATLITRGLEVFEGTVVASISNGTVITDRGHTVRARHVITCLDRFTPELGFLESEVYQIQTFLGITVPLSLETVRALFPGDQMMVWDTDFIYHYYRITGDNRLLIGGADLINTYKHRATVPSARIVRKLAHSIERKFAEVTVDLEYVWPGMLGIAKDLLPIVSSTERDGVISVAAATGLPWAASLGVYAAEKIVEGREDFDARFSPHRTFFVHPYLQKLVGKPVSFAISNGAAKYLG